MFINVFFLLYLGINNWWSSNCAIESFIPELFRREIIIISSAYKWYLISGKFRTILYIGVIYKEYSKGPITVHCSTPNSRGLFEDIDSSLML